MRKILKKYKIIDDLSKEESSNDSYEIKLRKLCEGLEIQHIDKLIKDGQPKDFYNLGLKMTERIKNILDENVSLKQTNERILK